MASDVSALLMAMKMGKRDRLSFQDIILDQMYDKFGIEEYLL